MTCQLSPTDFVFTFRTCGKEFGMFLFKMTGQSSKGDLYTTLWTRVEGFCHTSILTVSHGIPVCASAYSFSLVASNARVQ
jgi:hypothetical protein